MKISVMKIHPNLISLSGKKRARDMFKVITSLDGYSGRREGVILRVFIF